MSGSDDEDAQLAIDLVLGLIVGIMALLCVVAIVAHLVRG